MRKKLKNNRTPKYIDGRIERSMTNSYTILAFMLCVLLFSACNNKEIAHDHDTYTCPMHPTVISNQPSTCPVCGMDLVRKAREGEEVKITEDLSNLLKSPNEEFIASIKTIKGEYKTFPVSVKAQGIVTYDTRRMYTIPSRVGGRLEKLYIKYAYQSVNKGEKIAELYSPELITVQRELLLLLENDATNATLIAATKNKLNLLGMTSKQINLLIARKQTTSTFSIFSPYTGYITLEQQKAPSLSGLSSSQSTVPMDAMESSKENNTAPSTTSQNLVSNALRREGTYISAGEPLFNVVSNEALRIELRLPAKQSHSIKAGDNLELDFGNGRAEQATVDLVQPFFNEGQNFVTIRILTKKVEALRIGQLVTAVLNVTPVESLWVPNQAVLDLGNSRVVFVKDNGIFRAKNITTGVSSEGFTEIVEGLTSSDEIASNAYYLVDSESFLKIDK